MPETVCAVNVACTLHLPKNAALLLPSVALHTSPGFGSFASAPCFVGCVFLDAIQHSFGQIRQDQLHHRCTCKAGSISELDTILVHDETKRYCCNNRAVNVMTYAGL